MSSYNQDNKRLVKNTAYMYLRMAVTMLVGLYTSRVVLRVLGVDDFGLYNVIGGIVAMFTFLNSAMVNTTSRFITVRLAKNSQEESTHIFNMALLIHAMIAIIILILGETVGLWYLQNKLVIPEGREFAAHWLYQLSIITCLLSILNVPFNASIIAHEKMGVYAYVQILDVCLKLVIVIILQYTSSDRLIFYGSLLACVSLLDFLIYFVYCRKQFREVRFSFFWDKGIFKEMMGFAGWALIGNFSNLFYTQGINLMLNAFCGPAVNAARGIAVQVQNVVTQFASNVQTAINPQILKSHALNETERLYGLIDASSRLCFYLLFLISLPIFIETDFLLKLWLGNVPEHTVSFVRIILMCVLLDAFINPMFTANLASGKLALYHGPLAILMYGFMLITYFSIKITRIPESVFISYFIACLIGYVMRIFILKKQVGYPPLLYIKQVLLRVALVVGLSLIAPIIVHFYLGSGWIDFLVTSFVALLSVIVIVYLLGITSEERKLALSFLKNRIKRIKDNNK